MNRRITQLAQLALACVVSLLALSGPTAIAQVDDPTRSNVDFTGLDVQAVAGWDGLVDRAKPIPISFMFNNYSDRIIEGQLFLSDPTNGREVLLGDILISPGSSRRFTTIRALPEWFECVVTLRTEDKILWRRILPIITGKEFSRGTNFVLFVAEGERRLTLTNSTANPAELIALANGENLVAGEDGRSVQCLTIKPWQVPNHPGPMVAARAIVFPEDFSSDLLNKVQWRAVAEWVCQGGRLFVHQSCPKVIEQLITTSPFAVSAPILDDSSSVRRVGLGAICEFEQPLFRASDNIRDQITQKVAKLPSHHISGMARSAYTYYGDAGQSEINQLWVVLFFGCYTFLCGITILLFRKTRRAIATYIVSVVAMASVLSIGLGIMLRTSQGDMRWTTVTQAGTNGVVQVGNLNVKSSGGRSTTVALYGSDVDLQITEEARRNNYYYYSHMTEQGFPPFNWTPRLVTDGDRRAVDVLIRPWGQRSLHATAFSSKIPSIQFELAYKPKGSKKSNAPGRMPTGRFSVALQNSLDVKLTEVWLVIGVTGNIDSNLVPAQQQRRQSGLVTQTTAHQLVALYQIKKLSPIGASQTFEDDFSANFNYDAASRYNDAHRCNFKNHSSISLPRISHLGTANAWIVATIPESPVLSIDEDKNDFTTHKGVHFFVQEIDPQEMPDAGLFFNTEEPSQNED